MTPATALYEARMALAEALRAHVPLVERHAAVELAEVHLWNDPDATLEQLRTAKREYMAAIVAIREGEARIEAAQKRERFAVREWTEALAEGR